VVADVVQQVAYQRKGHSVLVKFLEMVRDVRVVKVSERRQNVFGQNLRWRYGSYVGRCLLRLEFGRFATDSVAPGLVLGSPHEFLGN